MSDHINCYTCDNKLTDEELDYYKTNELTGYRYLCKKTLVSMYAR